MYITNPRNLKSLDKGFIVMDVFYMNYANLDM